MDNKENKRRIIEVNGLTKEFNGLRAVDNISFYVGEGDIFAFLGPNGAGKTTTIKILTTLLHPSLGEVKINGFDIRKDKGKARCSFGIVFQDPSLDDELTAWENLEFHGVLYGLGRKERRQRIKEMLEFVGLWEKRRQLVKNFSGGMKRRLEIARGLIHLPKILFLDEPTVGLDPQTRNHIWDYIKNLNKEKGLTVFLTNHYMEEAERVADKVAIIDQGRIVALGSPRELKEKTETNSLEEAFLSLTGKKIREEHADYTAKMRLRRSLRRH